MPRPTVYLDTNGWNSLCDWGARRSVRTFAAKEFLFSSVVLDEFARAGSHRARDLALFAWRITNRKKLRDHIELTAEEVSSTVRGRELDPYDFHRGFFAAWKGLRTVGASTEMKDRLLRTMDVARNDYQHMIAFARRFFRPAFDAQRRGSGVPSFTDVWQSMLSDGTAKDYVRKVLALERLERVLDDFGSRSLADLSCTRAWVGYHVALVYLAAYEPGRWTRASAGDQADYRHAAYAGLADVFVTDDHKMFRILTELMPGLRASVVPFSTFAESLLPE